MKKSNLNSSTILSSPHGKILKEIFGEEGSGTKPQAPPIESSVPQSPALAMMASILATIVDKVYDATPNGVQCMPGILKNGRCVFRFKPVDIENYEDVQTDKKFCWRIVRFFSDLDALSVERDIRVMPQNFAVECGGKMAAFDMIGDLLMHHQLTSLDGVGFETKKMKKSDLRDFFIDGAQMADDACKDPNIAEIMFTAIESRPYVSMAEYKVNLLKCTKADIPVSMQHVCKSINQEDGIYETRYFDGPLMNGGYH